MKRFLNNRALKILLVTNGIILIAGYMLAPIYALFVRDIGGDLFDASLTVAIFSFSAGITTLIAGRYADRIKENELIIVFGYVIIGVGFLLYIFADSIYSLLLIQALIGFAEATYSPAFNAIYSIHLDKNKEGMEWGAWESTNYFTYTAGAIIGGLIVTNFGFNALFITMSALAFCSALYLYLLPRKVL